MSGRVVVVVGGTSGIGLAAAQKFATADDRLVLAARSGDALQRAATFVREQGALDVQTMVCDVCDADAVTGLIDTTVRRHGRIDVVVDTATTMAYGRLEDVPVEVFTAVVDTAIHGTMNLARAVLPVFRRQHRGSLVIVNSLLGAVTVPSMGAYAVAKWGQRAIARTLQQEVRDEPDVHVSIVSPGSTNTPIYYQAANYVGRQARPPFPVLQPARLAAAISAVVDRPRRHVSARVGPANPLIVFGYRTFPGIYDAIVAPLFGLGALTRTALSATDGNVLAPRPDQDRVHGRWPSPAAPHVAGDVTTESLSEQN